MTPTKDANGDHVCEHGTAMDVHCCNCHSGFIFDKDHECAAPPRADALDASPTDDFDTPEDPQRTLDSLAAMLGWSNTPPRRVLEQEIKILRERVAALDAALKNKG